MKKIKSILLFLSIISLETVANPPVPRDENHPGSSVYPYESSQEVIEISGRKINIYLPKKLSPSQKFPVIVYGHGQALNETHYESTFNHLARKGIAVIFPKYDKGFFDRNWKRMASDYNNLTEQVLIKYKNIMNSDYVVYSGHSKGGYVALMAAGAPNFKEKAKSILLFAPAGFDEEYIKRLTDIPLTLIWGEEDNIIAKELVKDIFDLSKVKFKQFIEVKNYDELEADHFYMVTKKTIFGGSDTLNGFHYYGAFKWLVGAATDLADGNSVDNPYIYGELTNTTGIKDLKHEVIKSW